MSYFKDLITAVQQTALRYKGVHTCIYQSDDLNNAQNNHDGIQVYIDDVTRSDLNITTDVFKVELNILILDQPTGESGSTILDVQDNCDLLACNLLYKIENIPEYYGYLRVHDYSIITVSHVTDDDSAGARLTVVFEMPNPVDICNQGDHWNDEPYSGETDYDIDVDVEDIEEIDLNPINLPKNPIRC